MPELKLLKFLDSCLFYSILTMRFSNLLATSRQQESDVCWNPGVQLPKKKTQNNDLTH